MKTIPPSATVTISAIAHQKTKAGIHIYNFAVGDPVFPNHPVIFQAISKVLEEGYVPYAPVAGLPELRKLVAEWMGAGYTIDNTLVCCGGKYAIFASLEVLLEPGDEVLIPIPYWVSYPDMVGLFNGVPVTIPSTKETDWKITGADIEKHLTKKTKVLIFNNPSNPSGAVYTREEVADILKAAKKGGLMVIADEVYSDLVYDGVEFVSCAAFPEHKDHVLIVQSCSKNFGMAGWRVGFAIGPTDLIKAMTAVQGQSTTGTSIISQYAAIGALENRATVARYLREEMKKRRDFFVKTYNDLFDEPIDKPSAAIYVFVKIGGDSVKLCEKILNEANVAIVPGVAFGMEGYARFSFSEEEEEILKGLQALRKFYDHH